MRVVDVLGAVLFLASFAVLCVLCGLLVGQVALSALRVVGNVPF